MLGVQFEDLSKKILHVGFDKELLCQSTIKFYISIGSMPHIF